MNSHSVDFISVSRTPPLLQQKKGDYYVHPYQFPCLNIHIRGPQASSIFLSNIKKQLLYV